VTEPLPFRALRARLSRLLAPRLADRLLKAVLADGLASYLADPKALIPAATARRILGAAHAVAAGQPLPLALGEAWFWERRLSVNDDVLLPRPDSEVLVEAAARLLPPAGAFAEIGVGSGALSLGLLDARGDCRGYGTEIAAKAFRVARENLEEAICGGRYTLFLGDGTRPLAQRGIAVDLVLANPPYVGLRERLDPSLAYEPRRALLGGVEGCALPKIFALEAEKVLGPQGILVMECAPREAPYLLAFLRRRGGEVEELSDLGGRTRGVVWRLKRLSER